MLNVMRENLRHLKWVLWLVAIAMVLSLGYYFSGGSGGGPAASGWVAKVDGVEIPEKRFIDVARNMDRGYREQFADNYDQIRQALRLGTQAVQGLINEELMMQDARDLGLTVTPEEIAESIRTSPNLQDPTGQFVGTDTYVRFINQNFFGGVPAYEKNVANALLAEKWLDVITQSVTLDESEMEQLHRQRTEKTAIDYFVVYASDQTPSMDVSVAEVRAFYDAEQQRYLRKDGRRVRYIVVDRDAQQEKVELTEEAIQEFYQSREASYTHGEQRRARHILLRLDAEADDATKTEVRAIAEATLQRVQAGEDFGQLAGDLSGDTNSAVNGGDLGFFERGRMVPEFESAVFDTAVGELAPLTQTTFGYHIIQVTEAAPAGITPLEEVREELTRSLRTQRAQETTVSEAQRLQAELQSADQLAALAEREGLTIESAFFESGETLTNLGAAPDFMDTVFGIEVGGASPPLRMSRGMALVVVDEEIPASVAPFDEVRDQVQADLLNERLRDAAATAARRALGERPMADAAKRADKVVQSSGDLAPGAAPPEAGGPSPELQAALFADTAISGSRGVVKVPAGALAYEITLRDPFDPAAFAAAAPALRNELMGRRRSMVQQSVLEKLRSEKAILVNNELVTRIDG